MRMCRVEYGIPGVTLVRLRHCSLKKALPYSPMTAPCQDDGNLNTVLFDISRSARYARSRKESRGLGYLVSGLFG